MRNQNHVRARLPVTCFIRAMARAACPPLPRLLGERPQERLFPRPSPSNQPSLLSLSLSLPHTAPTSTPTPTPTTQLNTHHVWQGWRKVGQVVVRGQEVVVPFLQGRAPVPRWSYPPSRECSQLWSAVGRVWFADGALPSFSPSAEARRECLLPSLLSRLPLPSSARFGSPSLPSPLGFSLPRHCG
jgi:hypothetical protein